MKNRRLFISIFAMSLAVTLLVSPVKVFNNPVVETIQVQAEEEPITDTQRGVALLMTIMLAQGLRFVGDWNTVVQPGLQKLWDDFSTATGNAVTLPMIVAGSSLALGYIRVSNTVNNAIANFTAWYKETFQQPVTGETDVPISTPEFVQFPNNTCTLLYNANGNNWYTWAQSADGDIRCFYAYVFNNPNCRNLYVMRKVQSGNNGYIGSPMMSCSAGSSGANYWTLAMAINGVTYQYAYWGVYSGGYNNPVLYNNLFEAPFINQNMSDFTQENQLRFVYEHTFGSESIADVSMEGQSLDLKDGYQLESDQAKLYDIAGLESLVASLALTLENIDDLVRDIPLIYDTPWSLDYPDNPTYVDTPDDTIPWVDVPDSVIPADTPEYVPTIPSERDEYKVLGLDQVFPFSIPFDFYYLSQILVSEPETPEFQYAAVNPVNGNLLTIDVDLHDFDGVASIFRTCETVLFIAFLIWITRSLIRS